MGKEPGDFFEEVVKEAEWAGTEIVWKEGPEKAKEVALAHVYHYYEKVGKYLDVKTTEDELLLDIGLDIPLLGYIDIVCDPSPVIDVKTTGYLNRNVKLNKEWQLQANIYQLKYPVPVEFHILTRAKSDPLIVPDGPDNKFYIPPVNRGELITWIKQEYSLMRYYYETWGEDTLWPGNRTHEWAFKYCGVEQCCQKV
jgi:hypothetical protein